MLQTQMREIRMKGKKKAIESRDNAGAEYIYKKLKK